MFRIDELITEIHVDEVVEMQEELTEEKKRLVENKVLQNINGMGKSRSVESYRTRRFPWRKRTVAILVASLLLMLGVTVFAAKENEWDVILTNFMGLNDPAVLQLEGGEVVINEKVTSEWVDYSRKAEGEKIELSITGITSIGDQNSAYLRVNTDYDLPEGFDEKTDYIIAENSDVDIRFENIFGNIAFRSYASETRATYENGKIGFLISIENCENLNRCNVSLRFENLYWYHDLGQYEETEDNEPEELLAAGSLETEWKYSYKSNVKTIHKLKRIETKEGEIFLTKIQISPISIRIEAIRNPKDRELSWTTDMLEEIQYKDGTTLQVEKSATGGLGNGIYIDEFVNVYYLGDVLRPKEIKCLKLCGETVDI